MRLCTLQCAVCCTINCCFSDHTTKSHPKCRGQEWVRCCDRGGYTPPSCKDAEHGAVQNAQLCVSDSGCCDVISDLPGIQHCCIRPGKLEARVTV